MLTTCRFVGAFLCVAALIATTPAADDPAKFDLDKFIKEYDKNKDGFIDRQECPEKLKEFFDRLDTNKDGKLSRQELEKVGDKLASLLEGKKGKGGGGKPGEVITPPAKGERISSGTLKVGDKAPDFTLVDPTGKNAVTLSSFKGKKPVVLVFGSYT